MARVQETSQSAAQRTKVPKCLDLLVTLWGRTPRERGTLLAAGGHHHERTPSTPTNESPHDMSQEPVGTHSVGQSSKRTHREHSINSPPSKKTVSIEECLEDLTQFIKNQQQQKAGSSKHEEEMAKVKQLMKQDGVAESDPAFAHALVVFKNTVDRRNFLAMETKEGRMNLIEACWEVLRARSK